MSQSASVYRKSSVGRIQSVLNDDGLMRGICLPVLLHNCSQILAESDGTASSYLRSEPVACLDAFFSHNWSVNRWWKFFVVMFHFNGAWAFAASYYLLAFCVVMTAAGYVPAVVVADDGFAVGVGCVFIIPCFLCVLRYADSMRVFLGFESKNVFLDKCCIHQMDAELKANGISKLPAFLHRSSSLVVCFTDEYLQRLWTVYEVASFLAVNRPERMYVVPALLPIGFLSVMIAVYLLSLGMLSMHLVITNWFDIAVVTYPIATFVIAIFLRKSAHERESLLNSANNFKLAQVKCYCEADRAIVERNIVDLMKACDVVGERASRQEAVVAFDNLVKREVPQAFDASFGRVGIRYIYTQMISLPYLSLALNGWAAQLFKARSRSLIIMLFTRCIMMPLVVFPVFIASLALTLRQCMNLKGFCEFAYITTAVAVNTILFYPVHKLSSAAAQQPSTAEHPTAHVLALAVIYVFLFAAAIASFRPRQVSRKASNLLSFQEAKKDVIGTSSNLLSFQQSSSQDGIGARELAEALDNEDLMLSL